jgi:hypothetical protein
MHLTNSGIGLGSVDRDVFLDRSDANRAWLCPMNWLHDLVDVVEHLKSEIYFCLVDFDVFLGHLDVNTVGYYHGVHLH